VIVLTLVLLLNFQLHRLYSSEMDGRSFNRLEWSLLGYDGPTLVVVKTDKDAVIGAFANKPWKDSIHFQGNSECFLFQLEPEFHVRWAAGPQDHFMYLHSGEHASSIEPQLAGLPRGIGFGGSTSTKPRLFIPDTLEHCSAEYMDKSYQVGDLLPEDAMEKFEIQSLEVWGVGNEDVIAHAMQKRAEYRVQLEDTIRRARTVINKKQFVEDLKTGFTPNKLYQHRDDSRGRHEFMVDDVHGGYKIDQD
jgi:hypothetical protein